MDAPQPRRCRTDIQGDPWSPSQRHVSEKLVSRRGWALSSPPNPRRPANNKSFKSREGQRSAIDVDYDRWLDRRLHQLYDPVLTEEIPPEMASLLAQFEEKPPEGGGEGES
jgi:hypothetical protein